VSYACGQHQARDAPGILQVRQQRDGRAARDADEVRAAAHVGETETRLRPADTRFHVDDSAVPTGPIISTAERTDKGGSTLWIRVDRA
jgi:hypothetical protein